MEKLYESLTADEKKQFWQAMYKAMKWRGWDRSGGGMRLGNAGQACNCHACDLINFIESLAANHGISFEEYT